MPHLALALFGPLRLSTTDGSEIPVSADKARALLAYLAVESGQPHRRESLAGLLWPGYTEHSARQSLSQALFVLNRVLAPALNGDPSPLSISRMEVQLDCSGCSLDAGTFEQRLAEAMHHGHPFGSPCDECAHSLAEALALYRGEFLTGFSLRDCPEFEEWLLLQRERYHRLAVEAAAALARSREGDEGLAHARRWVALDPLDEGAHRRLMALLALAGHRTLALTQYEACAHVLREELGVEPEPATRALFERIRAGDPALVKSVEVTPVHVPEPRAAAPAPIRHNLPAPVDSFVGRERELAEVRGLVEDPAARLVTLVGGGGMGKTRLALEVARACLPAFAGGAWIVDLAPLAAGTPATSALAAGASSAAGGVLRL
ncbi:MAG: SARP family transcriptional regulator, partial [Chloroflexi bacterium]|nr:SARP family transcriptional regulator [Chloroflexota bacterium]